MSLQADLFAAPPAPIAPPVPVDPNELVYSVVPKGERYGINWKCGEQTGVVGGLYVSEDEALSCIEFRRELRAEGIRDPRPWMRTPPEGVMPR